MKFNLQVTITGYCYTSEYCYLEVAKSPDNNTRIFSTTEYHYPDVAKFPGNNAHTFFEFGHNFKELFTKKKQNVFFQFLTIFQKLFSFDVSAPYSLTAPR